VSARTTSARHRAARRPLTPLSDLAQSVASTGVGRRAAVAATAGGILVSTFGAAGTAQAAPVQNEATKLSSVDLNTLSDQAREALAAAPVVTVASDAQVSVEAVTAEGVASVGVTPAPVAKPKVVEKKVETAKTASTERAAATSRSAERTTTKAVSTKQASTESASTKSTKSTSAAVDIAMRYIGVKYVVGGSSPSGFDCSGLVAYVYGQLGIDLPHQSRAILDSPRTTRISASEARPGDLLWSPGHISIYAGNGKQVEASRPQGWKVDLNPIWQSNPVYLRVS
jgi:cell wall-associated NlpC family hydrolase